MKFFSKRKSTVKLLLLFMIVALPCNYCMAQSQEKIYSLMLVNFAKGIYWPRTAITEEKFIIGVLGYPPLVAELKQTSLTTRISGKKIEIKELDAPTDVAGCHILFLPAYKVKWLPEILTSLSNTPTLIVSNKSNLAKNGGAINFVLLNGKLFYEINCASIEKRGMKISASVKTMGIPVE